MKKTGLWICAVGAVALAALTNYWAFKPKYYPLPVTGATLSGQVIYRGKPLPAALVIVAGDDWSSTGFISGDGKYEVPNAPLGHVKVGINTAAARGQMMGQVMAAAVSASKSGGKAPAMPSLVDVPAKYADPSKSGLATVIEKGSNNFEITFE